MFDSFKQWFYLFMDRTKIDNPILYVFILAAIVIIHNLLDLGQINFETSNQIVNFFLDIIEQIVREFPLVSAAIAGRRTTRYVKESKAKKIATEHS